MSKPSERRSEAAESSPRPANTVSRTSARMPASPGGTSTALAPATSSMAVPLVVTSVVPQARASRAGRPNPSYSDGYTAAVAERRSAGMAASSTYPVRTTRSPRPEVATAASGLGDRVVRTGYVDDAAIPALLRSATAAVYPSLYEGFGLPALEALACGTTLVTTSGTAMEEVAGASALLVPPGDAGLLADVLDTVLTGRGDERAASERRSLGFDIVERHTWRASADLHVAAYRTAAESGP